MGGVSLGSFLVIMLLSFARLLLFQMRRRDGREKLCQSLRFPLRKFDSETSLSKCFRSLPITVGVLLCQPFARMTLSFISFTRVFGFDFEIIEEWESRSNCDWLRVGDLRRRDSGIRTSRRFIRIHFASLPPSTAWRGT